MVGSRSTGVRRRRRGRMWRRTGPGPMTTTWPRAAVSPTGSAPHRDAGVEDLGALDGDGVRAVGRRPRPDDRCRRRGRLRRDGNAVRFVEVTVNGPKTWSLAAALHPDVAAALRRGAGPGRRADHRLGRRARHHPGRAHGAGKSRSRWSGSRRSRCGTTPPGPVTRTGICTSSSTPACFADGAWRGLHTVGFRDCIEAINGIGHAAVTTDPGSAPRWPGRVHPRPGHR